MQTFKQDYVCQFICRACHKAGPGVTVMMVVTCKLIRRLLIVALTMRTDINMMASLHGHCIVEHRMFVLRGLNRSMLDRVDHLCCRTPRIDKRQCHAKHDEQTVKTEWIQLLHVLRLTAWDKERKGRAQSASVHT